MTFTLTPEFCIAVALNLLLAGVLWGNLSTRLGTVEREMRDVKKDVKDHGDLELLVARCTSELRAMRRDLDRLLDRAPDHHEDDYERPLRRRHRDRGQDHSPFPDNWSRN